MIIDYHSSIMSFVGSGRLPLWVTYVAEGKHPERRFHDHEYSEIAIVMKGGARHLTDDGSAHLKAGDVAVIHPGTVHAYDKTGDMELINIVYDRSKLSLPMLDAYSLPLFKAFFPDRSEKVDASPVANLKPHDLEGIIEMVRDLESELKSFRPGNLFASLALFMEIIVRIARLSGYEIPEQRMRFLIGDAISYINKHYDRPITIDELIGIVHMSRRNFFRRFRNEVGCSPIEYLMKVRLHHASEMLLYTDRSVSDIAHSCGFYDGNFFCRKFRENFSITPQRFRRQPHKKMNSAPVSIHRNGAGG